jgi:hypothetical protein
MTGRPYFAAQTGKPIDAASSEQLLVYTQYMKCGSVKKEFSSPKR